MSLGFNLISLGVLCLAQNPSAQTYSLKFLPKEGTTTAYRMTGTVNLQGVSATMDSKVVQKVLKVDADGTYSMQSNTVEGKVVYAGQEMPMPANSSVTVYKSTGEVISVTGDQLDQTVLRSEHLVMLKRPDSLVKANDSWIVEEKADPAKKTPSLHGQFKFDGEELVGGVQALKIESDMSEGDVAVPAQVKASFWIDKADGSMVKYDCKYTNMPFPGSPGPLSGTLSMMRIAG